MFNLRKEGKCSVSCIHMIRESISDFESFFHLIVITPSEQCVDGI